MTLEIDDSNCVVYRYKAFRFLLSDGSVIDVTAISDSSDVRAAVLKKFALTGQTIVGVAKSERDIDV